MSAESRLVRAILMKPKCRCSSWRPRSAAAIVIWLVVDSWIAGRTSIALHITQKPIDLLAPDWLHLVAVVPAFFAFARAVADRSVASRNFSCSRRCGRW